MKDEKTTILTIDYEKEDIFLNQLEWLKNSAGKSHIYLDIGSFSKPYMLLTKDNGYVKVADIEIKNINYIGNSGDIYIGRNIRSSNKKFTIETAEPMPGEDPSSLMVLDNICDHCGSKRFRKSYYFFRRKDGSIIKVGSSCVKEYFGYDVISLVDKWTKLKKFWKESPYKISDIRYRIENIYSAIKEISNDFEDEWSKTESKDKVFDRIRKGTLSVTLKEVKNNILKIENTAEHLTGSMANNLLEIIYDENGKIKQIFKANEVARLAWAFLYANKKTKEMEENIFKGGDFVNKLGEKISIRGTLVFDYTTNDNFGGLSHKYSLKGIDGNNYEFFTKIEIEDLINRNCKFMQVEVRGVLGKIVEKEHGKYAGLKFNRLKGRINIKELPNN